MTAIGKIAAVLTAATLSLGVGLSPASAQDAIKKDNMGNSSMSKDTMGKGSTTDGMAKTDTKTDSMSKDGMAKGDAMKNTSNGMSKDGMSK